MPCFAGGPLGEPDAAVFRIGEPTAWADPLLSPQPPAARPISPRAQPRLSTDGAIGQLRVSPTALDPLHALDAGDDRNAPSLEAAGDLLGHPLVLPGQDAGC